MLNSTISSLPPATQSLFEYDAFFASIIAHINLFISDSFKESLATLYNLATVVFLLLFICWFTSSVDSYFNTSTESDASTPPDHESASSPSVTSATKTSYAPTSKPKRYSFRAPDIDETDGFNTYDLPSHRVEKKEDSEDSKHHSECDGTIRDGFDAKEFPKPRGFEQTLVPFDLPRNPFTHPPPPVPTYPSGRLLCSSNRSDYDLLPRPRRFVRPLDEDYMSDFRLKFTKKLFVPSITLSEASIPPAVTSHIDGPPEALQEKEVNDAVSLVLPTPCVPVVTPTSNSEPSLEYLNASLYSTASHSTMSYNPADPTPQSLQISNAFPVTHHVAPSYSPTNPNQLPLSLCDYSLSPLVGLQSDQPISSPSTYFSTSVYPVPPPSTLDTDVDMLSLEEEEGYVSYPIAPRPSIPRAISHHDVEMLSLEDFEIQQHIIEGHRIRSLDIDVDVMPIDRDQPKEAALGLKDYMAAMASSRPSSNQIPLNRISYRSAPAPPPSTYALQTRSYHIFGTPSLSSSNTAATSFSSSSSTAPAPPSRLDKGKGRAY